MHDGCESRCDCSVCEYQGIHDKILQEYREGKITPMEMQDRIMLLLLDFAQSQMQGQ